MLETLAGIFDMLETLAGILDMLETIAGILHETEPLFSQLVHDRLFLHLKEFERYFPITIDPRTGKE